MEYKFDLTRIPGGLDPHQRRRSPVLLQGHDGIQAMILGHVSFIRFRVLEQEQ